MTFNLVKLEFRYFNAFRNGSTTNKGMLQISPIFCQKLVDMATSLKGPQSDIPGYQALLQTYHPEILVKFGPLDFQIPRLEC